MTHIIFDLCIRDGACVEVCPVECIIPGEPENDWPWFFIDPETCIDCGACVPECPTEAILPEEDMESNVDDTLFTFEFISGMSEDVSEWLVENGEMKTAGDLAGNYDVEAYENGKPLIGGGTLDKLDDGEDVLVVSATKLNYAYFDDDLDIAPGYPE